MEYEAAPKVSSTLPGGTDIASGARNAATMKAKPMASGSLFLQNSPCKG